MNSLTVLAGITVGLIASVGAPRQAVTGTKSLSGSKPNSLNRNGLMVMHAAEGDEQRVAVRLRARDELCGEVAGAAGLVLDNDRLSPHRVQLLRHQPRDDVGAAAGGSGNHKANGAIGISSLRRGVTGIDRQQRDQRRAQTDFILVLPRQIFSFQPQNAQPSVKPMPCVSRSRRSRQRCEQGRTHDQVTTWACGHAGLSSGLK